MDHPELQNAVQTDAEKLLADYKAINADLDAKETSASGWVKTHIAWIIGMGCLLAGFILGYLRGRGHIV